MAEYVQVSLEEIQKFLKRAFHSMPFKSRTEKGETVLDLAITDNVGVRVYTSVRPGRDLARGVGEDAIRVVFFNLKKDRPLKRGKGDRVYRIKTWRDNLRKRIEDLLEEYYEKEDYWDGLAAREGDGASEKQIEFAKSLLRRNNYPEPDWKSMSSRDVSKLIDDLKAGRVPGAPKSQADLFDEMEDEEREIYNIERRQR